MDREVVNWLGIVSKSEQIARAIDFALIRAAHKHSPVYNGAQDSDENTYELIGRMMELARSKAEVLDMAAHTVSAIADASESSLYVAVVKNKYVFRMTMNEIQDEMKIGQRTVYRWHNMGVDKITPKLRKNGTINKMLAQGTQKYFREISKNIY